MANTFRSERLVYRAIEDNDEDIKFLSSLNQDSEGRIHFSKALFKPVNKEHARNEAETMRKAFFGAIVCIPISSEDKDQNAADAASEILKPIGRLELWKIGENLRQHRNTKIAIFISSEYRRKGYGSEAIKWLLNWAFQMAGLHRVGISCFSYNTGARKLYERLGFVYEGMERDSVWYDGEWYGTIFLGMLKSEWRARGEKEKSESGRTTISIDGWTEAEADLS
jgi:RimJ/RimL family protein N-acetyltransferase